MAGLVMGLPFLITISRLAERGGVRSAAVFEKLYIYYFFFTCGNIYRIDFKIIDDFPENAAQKPG